MANNNPNKSQFIRTYGKPRYTQGLGQVSVWHDDLVDDFDKCFGIDDVQHTTFISPESSGPVSIYKHKKHVNKMNTVGGWSMLIDSTMNDHKDNLALRRRNNDSGSNKSYNKKTFLLNSTEKKKKKNNHFNTDWNPKVTSTLIKPKKKFVLSKKQCSTPRSTLLQKSKSIVLPKNVNRKKCKSKVQKKLANAFEGPYSSECSGKSDHSQIKSSNLPIKEVFDKHGLVEESILISGSNSQLINNNKKISRSQKNPISNVCKKNNKKNSNKSKKLDEKRSKWFIKVKNILCDEISQGVIKESYNDDHNNENVIVTLGKSLENYSSKSTVICGDYKNVMINNSSAQQQQYSSQKEDYVSDFNSTEANKSTVIDIKDSIDMNTDKFQSMVPDYNSSELCFDSLDESYYQVNTNKAIENIEPSIIIRSSGNIFVDEPFNYESNATNNKLFQPHKSQASSSSCVFTHLKNKLPLNSINNSCNLDLNYSNESCADSLDVKLLKVLVQNKNHELNLSDYSSFNKSSCLSVENNVENNENQYVPCESNSESFDLVDVMCYKSSDINNTRENVMQNQFVNEKCMLEKMNQSLSNMSLDESEIQSKISNNSSSILNSSSSLIQDTVIYKQNCSDEVSKEDVVSNGWVSDDANAEPLKSKYSFEIGNLETNGISQYCNSSTLNTSNNYTENESFYFQNECIKTKPEKFQNNYSRSSRLLNRSKDTFSDSINISSIKHKKNASVQDCTIISNEISDQENKTEQSINGSRRKRYAVRFENSSVLNTIEESFEDKNIDVKNSPRQYLDQITSFQQNVPAFRLEPGKKWRRSIVIVRNFFDGSLDETRNTAKGRKWISTVDEVLRQQQSTNTTIHQQLDQSNIFGNSIFNSSPNYSLRNSTIIHRQLDQSNIFKNSRLNLSQNHSRRNFTDVAIENESAQKFIFDICNQKQPISFKSWLEPMNKMDWIKVGEGVYGEVFCYSYKNYSTVVKIIPIEGETLINDEQQKKMFEVFSEILVASELNKLLDKKGRNQTDSFCKLKNMSCVQGKYPEYLIKLWDQYNHNKGSDNDNPIILPAEQVFMIIEMENGGVDVETYVFNSASQSLHAFLQVVFALAVAEQQYNFEHRDLHIGNILVQKIAPSQKIVFKLDGKLFSIPSGGVKISIIDFTLSRITHCDKSIYNDLAKDNELFSSHGDYQFEIYRLMREETNNQWASYKPKTNVYWLHYLLDKLLEFVHYKRIYSKVHKKGIQNLEILKNTVLMYDSAKSFAESELVLKFLK